MKKIISFGLVLTMVLSLFVGCSKENETNNSNLPNAKAYLTNMYQTAGKGETMDLLMDKDVLSVVTIDGVSYNVEWSVTITEGASDAVKVVASDKKNHVKIDVPEMPEADILLTATAVISDAKGNKEAVNFNYKVGAVAADKENEEEIRKILDAAFALENGHSMETEVTLTGKVSSIDSAYNPQYGNISVYITVLDKEILCYRMKGDGADKIVGGDTITVTGIIKNYNGIIEFDAGCTMRNHVSGGVVAPTDMKEIVEAAYALEPTKSLPYTATLKGTIVSIDDPYSAEYGNITVTIKVDGCEDKPIKCYRMKGEGADALQVGDVITVTGVIKNHQHSSGDCEVEFNASCTFVK